MPEVDEGLNYLEHLRSESGRFVAALSGADPGARVPSCPDWDADDLLWHLARVQGSWGTIVRERLVTHEQVAARAWARPPTHHELVDQFLAHSAALVDALATTPDDLQVWTWAPDAQRVGFVRRRQAHEALIHRVDAELTAGSRTPLDPALADDGVDEVLRVMYGGEPAWGTFTADPRATVRAIATDSGSTWFLTIGRFFGTSPDGEEVDDRDLRVAATDPGTTSDAEVRGTAADLDCWLWRRPPLGAVELSGDPVVLAAFEATIGPGIG
jgi:uncharacterized protein (TIGR03083 family)